MEAIKPIVSHQGHPVIDMKGVVDIPSEATQFELFLNFLENSLDEFKEELSMLSFPIF